MENLFRGFGGFALVFVVTTAVYLGHFQTAEATELCVPEGCDNDNCKVPCEHGTCQPNGECACKQCFSGQECSIYENQAPVFDRAARKIHMQLDAGRDPTKTIMTFKADDPDGECSDPEGCPCTIVQYRIVSGNGEGLFSLTPSGELKTNEMGMLEPGSKHRLMVAAFNPEQDPENLDMQSYAMVKIKVEDMFKANSNDYGHVNGMANGMETGGDRDIPQPDNGGYGYDDNAYEPHSRGKRAIPTSPNTVDNVTFYLEKSDHYATANESEVGSMIKFKLAIHIPEAGSDLLVELFTPDNDTTYFCICTVDVTNGPMLTNDIGAGVMGAVDVNKEFEAMTIDSWEYNRVILNFGNVTCDASQAGADDCRIYITWQTVMLRNTGLANADIVWLSAGGEYNDDEEVWVGQASMAVIVDPQDATMDYTANFGTPTFELTGPVNGEVEIGTTNMFKVKATIPYPVSTIAFDAFTPLNGTDVMSACSALLVGVGEAYECIPKDKFNYELFENTEGKGNSRTRLDVGLIVNKNSRETGGNFDLTTQYLEFDFAMYVYDNESHIGNEYWVGAAIEISNTQIWAGQIYVLVVNKTSVNTLVKPVPKPPTKALSNKTPKTNSQQHKADPSIRGETYVNVNGVKDGGVDESGVRRVAVLEELIQGESVPGWVKVEDGGDQKGYGFVERNEIGGSQGKGGYAGLPYGYFYSQGAAVHASLILMGLLLLARLMV